MLNTLIAHGSVPARFRHEELTRLREMLLLVIQQDDGSNDAGGVELEPSGIITFGMTPNHISSIADLLGSYPDMDAMTGTGNDSWLWEAEAAADSYV